MNYLENFILSNTKNIRKNTNNEYRHGISDVKNYECVDINELQGDDEIMCHLVSFKVKKENSGIKRILLEKIDEIENPFLKVIVLCEINQLNSAKNVIEEIKKHFFVQIDVIGAVSQYKKYNKIENEALFVHFSDLSPSYDIQNRKLYKFETEECIFIEEKVCALNVKEQKILILLLFYTLKLSNLDKNQQSLHIDFAKAYFERLLFIRNEPFVSKNLLISHFRNILYNETNEIPSSIEIDKEIPLILCYEYSSVLARNYFKKYFFESALRIYEILHDHMKIVKCYLGMEKEEEMYNELKYIQNHLERSIDSKKDMNNEKLVMLGDSIIFNVSEISAENLDKMTLSEQKFNLINTYHLLAELKCDIQYYDKSYSLYQSHETLKLKALHQIRQLQLNEALETLNLALKHSQCDIQLLHMIACTRNALYQNTFLNQESKTEYDNSAKHDNLSIQDGEEYFMKILAIDPDNYDTLLNLADLKTQQDKKIEAVKYLKKAFRIHPSVGCAKKIISILEENSVEELNNFLKDESLKHIQEISQKYNLNK